MKTGRRLSNGKARGLERWASKDKEKAEKKKSREVREQERLAARSV